MRTLGKDLRYGIRALARTPASTPIAILLPARRAARVNPVAALKAD